MSMSLFPDASRVPVPYLQPKQAQRRPPTDYENLLADALEAAFGSGVEDLEGLAAHLNAAGVRAPDGTAWSAPRLQAALAELGK